MNCFLDYQERAKRTLNDKGKDFEQMVSHMLMGIQGESGEVADLFKKHFHQEHDLDTEKVLEEMGDVMFYIANLCNVMGISLQEVCERNIIKLMKRYPEGFDAERSINRE
ncbi:MazG nucleotide pyrophosphohydrolase domain protein [Andreesenia angusta]|uniref:MazG nucleotide pyrophosphohydrolase domain protein n=1 Tax=Andreesenia angusta TaxID=39480 RepID=A0A1S1V942_9FIRM|nr:nucleoside triphosphate pyrophosphohydrolase family protein [Andreesenia angusta]OHW62925.1 MazG nucleotide pyrophosphohydrolase domain protein [Andreesenia angusta]